jgi:hypothetical protein
MGRDRTDVAAKRKALAVGSQGLITVMRGQKRVEDARKRAYHPRIHLLRKKLFPRLMDCRVKPGNDDLALAPDPCFAMTGEVRDQSPVTKSCHVPSGEIPSR